ncbi:MAG TPA: TrbG/VirB9 family P-type conjugative transfer protein, partial [Gemmatimonadaceae bacterium]|nr:TrbG/VirB9 family P-type conjugative transfer protein [Gemmatimonadaceae bacterium]
MLCKTVTQPLMAQSSASSPVADPIAAATREYQRTGIARTVQMGDLVVVPYGTSQPTLTCAALRTCVIELQPGEMVYGIPPHGDADRWSIHTVGWGPNATNPVIIVKPLDCDITTNVVVLTNRHLYDLSLDAPPCPGVAKADTPTSHYMRRIRFYYPDEELTAWANAMPLATSNATPNVGLESLHYDYRWSKDKDFPWSPDVVFDDGAHLYIKIPSTAEHSVAPVLFAVDDHGHTSLLNYTVRNGFYVTDRIVQRAALVMG